MKTNLLTLLKQTSDFVVIDKPAGLNFHTEEGESQKSPGVVVQLKQQLQVKDLYPVHRLDKMTSGLLVFALNLEMANHFRQLFETKQIEKYYLAIATDKPKKKQGWIKGDMEPARRGSWKLCKSMENPAMTQFISQSVQPKERAFLLKPHTGKTHQLRVALKSLGAPISGDSRYQNSEEAKQEQRGYLHAYALQFDLKGETFNLICPPTKGERFVSEAFQNTLASWQTPWALNWPVNK